MLIIRIFNERAHLLHDFNFKWPDGYKRLHKKDVDGIKDDTHGISCIEDLLNVSDIFLLNTIDSSLCFVQVRQCGLKLFVCLCPFDFNFVPFLHA